MKKVIWKDDFLPVNEEHTDKLKRDYYMALGAYKQKLEDVSSHSDKLGTSANWDHTVNLVVSMIAKRSTVGTEELEGYKPNISELEENLHENKLSVDDESNVSLSILKMYINHELPIDDISLDDIKEIHRKFYSSKKLDYKAGKFRTKNDNNVAIESAQKMFVESKNVQDYMNKFIVKLNGYNNYDPIVKVAMIHGILLGIHPFKDGNGRVTRFITDKLLSRELNLPLFLSEAINSRAIDSSYSLALDSFHLQLDSLPLIIYFYEVAIDQLKRNTKLLNEYIVTFNKIKERLLESGFKIKYAVGLSELMATQDNLKLKDIENHLGVTKVTASNILNSLVESKFIRKNKEQGRTILFEIIK